MFKFLHAADIHLDSPLKGLEKYEGAPVDEIRGATRRALENLVELAIEQKVDFVLIAGDLYYGDWKDHNTGLFFVSQMVRLREADIPVIAISGNHDAANKMTKSLRLPDNVEWLSHRRPQTAKTKRLEELGVAVHGRSYAKAAELENLALEYPDKSPGMFNIGLLHTSLTGAKGHERYAPCSLDDQRSKGYDYWALGHVHQRQVACDDPHVVFSGNIQGRHIRETDAKGCYLVAVDDRGSVDLEFQRLDVFRWAVCNVSATGAERPGDVLDLFSDELSRLIAKHDDIALAVRVQVAGRCLAHDQLVADQVHWTNQFRSTALEIGGGRVWIEKVKFATSPERAVKLAPMTDGPLGEVSQLFNELRTDDDQLADVASELDDLRKKLPADLAGGDEAMRFDDPDWLRGMLGEVEPLLISRLQEEAEQ